MNTCLKSSPIHFAHTFRPFASFYKTALFFLAEENQLLRAIFGVRDDH